MKDPVGCDAAVCLTTAETCEGCGRDGFRGFYSKSKPDYSGKEMSELCPFGARESLCIPVYADLAKELTLATFIRYHTTGGALI